MLSLCTNCFVWISVFRLTILIRSLVQPQVVCTLGSMVFVSMLLVRGIWSFVTYTMENQYNYASRNDDEGSRWSGVGAAWFMVLLILWGSTETSSLYISWCHLERTNFYDAFNLPHQNYKPDSSPLTMSKLDYPSRHSCVVVAEVPFTTGIMYSSVTAAAAATGFITPKLHQKRQANGWNLEAPTPPWLHTTKLEGCCFSKFHIALCASVAATNPPPSCLDFKGRKMSQRRLPPHMHALSDARTERTWVGSRICRNLFGWLLPTGSVKLIGQMYGPSNLIFFTFNDFFILPSSSQRKAYEMEVSLAVTSPCYRTSFYSAIVFFLSTV